jgi:hypothetical protein
MGLPAERAGAPLTTSGPILSLEGQFISLAGDDPSAPGIVGFTADWPNVVADIQIYSRSQAGDRLSEDLEFNLADANQAPERMPAGVLDRLLDEAARIGSPVAELPPAAAADLDAAAAAAASAAARQLATYFADQGWIQSGEANS